MEFFITSDWLRTKHKSVTVLFQLSWFVSLLNPMSPICLAEAIPLFLGSPRIHNCLQLTMLRDLLNLLRDSPDEISIVCCIPEDDSGSSLCRTVYCNVFSRTSAFLRKQRLGHFLSKLLLKKVSRNEVL